MGISTGKVVAVVAMLVIIILQASTRPVVGRPGAASASSSSKVDGDGIPAVMTVNGFERGGSGGGPSECDGKYHSDDELLAALSSQWYDHGRRCQKSIRITSARTGRTVEARVVDECDSNHGRCRGNDVDTSRAVWKALGLDTNVGEVPVAWSDA